jgi:tetratricopeptide (TPR) repeat protein
MTAKAPIASSDPAGTSATNRPTQQLWQVPTFLLGVAVLAGAWAMHHCCSKHSCAQARELSAARQMLSRPDGAIETVVPLLTTVLEQVKQDPSLAGEVQLLLGTAKLRLGDKAQPAQAPGLYQSARQDLQEAQRLGVPSPDEGPLLYRLAKADFVTGADPDKMAQRLASTVDLAEPWEKADAYNLLTEAYLRQNPPDYKAALAANEKLRSTIAMVPDEVLGPAKVRGAELLLKLHRFEEARKALTNPSVPIPPPLQARARLLLAQSHHEEGHWQDAAALWKVALEKDVPEGTPERGAILYQMGLCYRKLEQPQPAITAWESCCQAAPSAEGPAAALGLAELYLQDNQLDQANGRLRFAVRDVKGPEDWKDPRIDVIKTRELFERTCQAFREASRYDLAEDLVGHYERIAEKGRPALLRAEVLADWGRARRKAAGQLKDAEAQQREEEQARDLFCRAGAAFDKAAGNAALPADQANLLWQAIGCYREAPDHVQVIALIDRFLPINDRDERNGEGWYLVGEAQRQGNHVPEAEKAYNQCIQYSTPFAYRARYQLALFALQRGQLDKAESILEQNLSYLRVDPAPDAEAREKSLFALGNLYFKKRNYRQAERRLVEALAQFPLNPDVPLARFQLAESYRQMAIQMNQESLMNKYKNPATEAHTRNEYRSNLEKAAQEFLELAYALDKVPTVECLTQEERILVPFHAAECRFNLGKYDEALQLYEVLAERYPRKLEGLRALAGTVRCLSAMQQDDQLRKRLEDIRQVVAGLEGPLREEWDNWLRVAERPTQPVNPGPR